MSSLCPSFRKSIKTILVETLLMKINLPSISFSWESFKFSSFSSRTYTRVDMKIELSSISGFSSFDRKTLLDGRHYSDKPSSSGICKFPCTWSTPPNIGRYTKLVAAEPIDKKFHLTSSNDLIERNLYLIFKVLQYSTRRSS